MRVSLPAVRPVVGVYAPAHHGTDLWTGDAAVSSDKGNRAGPWVATYLRRWWPLAESVSNGRQGQDILNTPGVRIEVKTGVTWREEWLKQARGRAAGGAITPLIYLGPGIGEVNVG